MNSLKKVLLLMTTALLAIFLIACDYGAKYTVEFVNTGLESVEMKEGDKLERPTNPSKEGYTFDDWYSDGELTLLFEFDQPVIKDTKVYALFYMSITKALETGAGLVHEEISEESYYVKGKIKSIDNVDYGNMTIVDDGGEIYVYGVWSSDGLKKYSELDTQPVVGDIVYLKAPLKKFNESIELNQSRLVKMTAGVIPPIDLDDYESVTNAVARTKDVGSLLILEGVVATITYANGKKPNGVYLVDHTGAMYVFSNEIASSVKVGNKIRVAGSRQNFILTTEVAAAEILGYEGAIQLSEAVLVEKDSGTADFETSWITEKTIKELMDTNVKTENITGTIYKVNAFIKKVPGEGFVNYYFYDLDGTTGSYTYTMNNGSDFSHLDVYDGELRTIYLSVINAKSTSSGVNYRLMPIKIGDIYAYNPNYNSELAVKYFGVGQFEKTYVESFSPDKELITSVNVAALNVENVPLTYESSNTSSVYFETVDGKVILKTNLIGTAIITVSSIHNEISYSEQITIEVVEYNEPVTLGVLEAINEPDETTVVVEGVVGASLVNKTGFYLIDETGVIAVEMTKEELVKVNLGDLVIVSGVKTHIGRSEDESGNLLAKGQIAIKTATIVVNKRGDHAYSTTSFIEGKDLAYVAALDRTEDHTTEVYIVEATIVFEDTLYYKRYVITSGATTINVYASGAPQLSFLDDYRDLTVTLELTVVNWNGKALSGSILSLTHNGVKVVNNSNFWS